MSDDLYDDAKQRTAFTWTGKTGLNKFRADMAIALDLTARMYQPGHLPSNEELHWLWEHHANVQLPEQFRRRMYDLAAAYRGLDAGIKELFRARQARRKQLAKTYGGRR
jgi:hypothetical protein